MGYYLLLLYWALRGALFLPKGCFAVATATYLFLSPTAGVFRSPERPTFDTVAVPKIPALLTADISLFASGGPISFNSERNGGKNAGKNCVFAFPHALCRGKR